VTAGVGNIYADEALFRAAIHPLAPSDKVPTPPLSVAIRRILSAAIAHGGSSIRDYIDANGERGRSQLAHQVYGRGGLPCMRCSTTLETGIVAQRTTVWCPTCQTAERTTDRTSGRTSGQTSGQTPGRTVDQTQPRTKPRTKPSPHASGRPASRFKAALR
jgi:formamidopyrimidine-DNA glycosylase